MDCVNCPIWGRAAYIDWCAHGQPAVGDIVLGQHDAIVNSHARRAYVYRWCVRVCLCLSAEPAMEEGGGKDVRYRARLYIL